MKMKINWIGSVIAAALVMTGCGKSALDSGCDMVTRVLYAENDMTRTLLDGRNVLWEEGDQVCCVAVYDDAAFGISRSSVYAGIKPEEMNGGSARIVVTCGGGYTPAYIVYPSSKKVSLDSETGNITIPVPASYELVEDNFPVTSNISVGVVEGNGVFMNNVMTLVRFEIAQGDTLKRITVSSNAGEALAGELEYDAYSCKVISTAGATELILDPPAGEEIILPGIYYFPLPSITLSEGFKVKIVSAENLVAEKSYDEELVLKRNRILDLGSTADWALKWMSNRIVLSAKVTDGVSLIGTGWPFVEALPAKADVCGKGLVGPFHLSDEADAPSFHFFVSGKTWSLNADGGLGFGGAEHDYMLLPAIDGYRLVSVTVRSAKSRRYAITDNPAGGVPTVIKGGTAIKVAKLATHTFDLTETAAGVAYRLDLPTTDIASLSEFELAYERTE